MKPTLDSIASAKAKLAEELRQLEQQEEDLRKEQTGGAFSKVIELLGEFGPHFDADSETVCITLNSYPDTQESIRAAMAADTSLSAAEKETVEHLYFSGLSF